MQKRLSEISGRFDFLEGNFEIFLDRVWARYNPIHVMLLVCFSCHHVSLACMLVFFLACNINKFCISKSETHFPTLQKNKDNIWKAYSSSAFGDNGPKPLRGGGARSDLGREGVRDQV